MDELFLLYNSTRHKIFLYMGEPKKNPRLLGEPHMRVK